MPPSLLTKPFSTFSVACVPDAEKRCTARHRHDDVDLVGFGGPRGSATRGGNDIRGDQRPQPIHTHAILPAGLTSRTGRDDALAAAADQRCEPNRRLLDFGRLQHCCDLIEWLQW